MITAVNVQDKLKLAVGSIGGTANWLTDAQYLDLVIGHALSTYQTYSFQAVTPFASAQGYYRLFGGLWSSSNPWCLFVVGTPYTEDSGVSSTFNCGWNDTAPNIRVTAGTPTSTTLTVTATPIDWRGMLSETISILKGHAAREKDSISLLGASSGFATLMERLDTWEQQVQGANYV